MTADTEVFSDSDGVKEVLNMIGLEGGGIEAGS